MSIEQLLGGMKVRDLARMDLESRRRVEDQQRAAEAERRQQQRAKRFHAQISVLFNFLEVSQDALWSEIPPPGDRITIEGYEFFLPEEGDNARLSVAIVCPDCEQRFERADIKRLADVGELDEELAAHHEQEHSQNDKSEGAHIL